jgi:hypothetical protein
MGTSETRFESGLLNPPRSSLSSVKVSFCELGSNGKGNKAKNPAKHNYVSKSLYNGIASASRRGFADFSCSNVTLSVRIWSDLKNHDCDSVAEKRFTTYPFIPILAVDRIAAP